PHKFQFLYGYFAQRPHLLNADHWQLLKAAHHITLGRGVQEDSGEYFSAMHGLLNQHAPPPQAAPATPPPAPPPEPMPPPMTHIEHIEHEPEPERDIGSYVSAPVSRSAEHYAASGEYQMTPSQVRLTPEQREAARAAGVDETVYAANLLK